MCWNHLPFKAKVYASTLAVWAAAVVLTLWDAHPPHGSLFLLPVLALADGYLSLGVLRTASGGTFNLSSSTRMCAVFLAGTPGGVLAALIGGLTNQLLFEPNRLQRLVNISIGVVNVWLAGSAAALTRWSLTGSVAAGGDFTLTELFVAIITYTLNNALFVSLWHSLTSGRNFRVTMHQLLADETTTVFVMAQVLGGMIAGLVQHNYGWLVGGLVMMSGLQYVLRMFFLANVTLQEKAERDGLTGLLNHAAIHDRLNEAIRLAHHRNEHCSVLLIDLSLKVVNDTYGHRAGDKSLVEWSKVLKESVRTASSDVARYGGDEFVVVLRDATQEEAERVKERILSRLPEDTELDGALVPVARGAIGVAVFPADHDTAAGLVEKADAKMYEEKRRMKIGRDSPPTITLKGGA